MVSRSILVVVLMLFSTVSSASELDLTVNGGFEPPLANGWEWMTTGGSEFDLRQDADSDPDWEPVLSHRSASGFSRIFQEVSLPVTSTTVGVSLDLDMKAHNGAWAAGGLILEYRDKNGLAVGRTLLVQRTQDNPWEDSPIQHIIDVPEKGWNTHTIDLELELENLSGVPLDTVHKLGVILFIEAANC